MDRITLKATLFVFGIVLLGVSEAAPTQWDSIDFNKPPVVLSAFASAAGGVIGGISGIGLGIAIEEFTGPSCSGSDFCIPAGPILGFSIGYPVGTALGLHMVNLNYMTQKPFRSSLLWSLLGMGLGGIGVAATSGQPLLATGVYVGMAHVFPAVMLSL